MNITCYVLEWFDVLPVEQICAFNLHSFPALRFELFNGDILRHGYYSAECQYLPYMEMWSRLTVQMHITCGHARSYGARDFNFQRQRRLFFKRAHSDFERQCRLRTAISANQSKSY